MLPELLEVLKWYFLAFVAWGAIRYYSGKAVSLIDKKREEKDKKSLITSRISRQIRLNKNETWESVEEIGSDKVRVLGPAEEECPEVMRFFDFQDSMRDTQNELLEQMGFTLPDLQKNGGGASLTISSHSDPETNEVVREIALEKRRSVPQRAKKKFKFR